MRSDHDGCPAWRLPRDPGRTYNGPMRRHLRILVVAVAVALLAAPAIGAPVRVRATSDSTWSPFRQRSAPGQRVVWTNPTGIDHTVTAYGGNWSKNVTIASGERTGKVFRRTGRFRYRCKIHSHLAGTECHGMCGVIRVAR